jgi:hypothetical protein
MSLLAQKSTVQARPLIAVRNVRTRNPGSRVEFRLIRKSHSDRDFTLINGRNSR